MTYQIKTTYTIIKKNFIEKNKIIKFFSSLLLISNFYLQIELSHESYSQKSHKINYKILQKKAFSQIKNIINIFSESRNIKYYLFLKNIF